MPMFEKRQIYNTNSTYNASTKTYVLKTKGKI